MSLIRLGKTLIKCTLRLVWLDVHINAGPIEREHLGSGAFVHQRFPLDLTDLLLQLKIVLDRRRVFNRMIRKQFGSKCWQHILAHFDEAVAVVFLRAGLNFHNSVGRHYWQR